MPGGLTEITPARYVNKDYPTVPFASYAWMHPEVAGGPSVAPDYPSVPFGIVAYTHAEALQMLRVEVIDALSGYPVSCAIIATEDGRTAMTNTNGIASLPITPGDHIVAVGSTGYDDAQESFTVEPAADYSVTIAMSTGGSGAIGSAASGLTRGMVNGRVLDAATGQPILGSYVTVDAGMTPNPVSGVGAFTLSLSPGAHVLTGWAEGYSPASFGVMVPAGGVVAGDIPLDALTPSSAPTDDAGGSLLPVAGLAGAIALLALL